MAAARILIGNQQRLGEAIQKLLEGEFLVLGVAMSVAEIVAQATKQSPDILLLDSAFLHEAGTAVLHRIWSQAPQVKLVVLAEQSDRFAFGSAVQLEAVGFVAKQQSLEKLPAALRTVARGQRYNCSRMQKSALGSHPALKRRGQVLTGCQQEVLQFVAGCEARRLPNFSASRRRRSNSQGLCFRRSRPPHHGGADALCCEQRHVGCALTKCSVVPLTYRPLGPAYGSGLRTNAFAPAAPAGKSTR